MRYKLIVLIGLLTFCFGFSSHHRIIARKNADVSGCTIPDGDVKKESFEAFGYDLGGDWAELNGAPDEDYVLSGLSGGTGDTRNCTLGLKTAAAGSMVNSQLDSGVNTAHPYAEFSFYADSHSLGGGTNVQIFEASSDSGAGTDWLFDVKVYFEASTFKIGGTGGTLGTKYAISIDAWYYMRIDGTDNGTCTIDIGTSYGGVEIANGDTFTCRNTTSNPRYYTFGVNGASRTVTGIFGYVAIDDDGVF